MEIQHSDIKFYRQIHIQRMKSQGETPVGYTAFTKRLKKMSLYDAIYSPRVEYQVRDQSPKTPIQDSIRRTQTLKEANIKILDLYELEHKKNKVNMKPKKRRTLLDRFISFFKW